MSISTVDIGNQSVSSNTQAPRLSSPISGTRTSEAILQQIAERFPLHASRPDLAKRGLDLVLGSLALLVALPVMAVIALLSRLDSPGPLLFRQQRIARGGRLFTIYKFRTMWSDSRERFPHLFDFTFSGQEAGNIYLQTEEDPRVTPLGRFLRRTSLDELPNLFNIVCGDMSLVGPRPEIPEVLPHYTDEQLVKFSVKPGLTGLAQIGGRGELSLDATIALDLEYCARRSLRYDLRILQATFFHVVRGDGAF